MHWPCALGRSFCTGTTVETPVSKGKGRTGDGEILSHQTALRLAEEVRQYRTESQGSTANAPPPCFILSISRTWGIMGKRTYQSKLTVYLDTRPDIGYRKACPIVGDCKIMDHSNNWGDQPNYLGKSPIWRNIAVTDIGSSIALGFISKANHLARHRLKFRMSSKCHTR